MNDSSQQQKLRAWLWNNSDNSIAWDKIVNRDTVGLPDFLLDALKPVFKFPKYKVHFYANGLYLRPSSIEQISETQSGLFCMFDIFSNTLIDNYGGDERTSTEQKRYMSNLSKDVQDQKLRYTFEYTTENNSVRFIDPTDINGDISYKSICAFVNEPPPNKVANLVTSHKYYEDGTNEIRFIACVHIPANKELFIKYGDTMERPGYSVGRDFLHTTGDTDHPRDILTGYDYDSASEDEHEPDVFEYGPQFYPPYDSDSDSHPDQPTSTLPTYAKAATDHVYIIDRDCPQINIDTNKVP